MNNWRFSKETIGYCYIFETAMTRGVRERRGMNHFAIPLEMTSKPQDFSTKYAVLYFRSNDSQHISK